MVVWMSMIVKDLGWLTTSTSCIHIYMTLACMARVSRKRSTDWKLLAWNPIILSVTVVSSLIWWTIYHLMLLCTKLFCHLLLLFYTIWIIQNFLGRIYLNLIILAIFFIARICIFKEVPIICVHTSHVIGAHVIRLISIMIKVRSICCILIMIRELLSAGGWCVSAVVESIRGWLLLGLVVKLGLLLLILMHFWTH